ncbi:cell division protein FtsB [Collimonas pratensis]|jgi:cell division protein FtsB|uniref:Cell division protein FtsB n=1 Tax=Collimonas pratensis TaxID=279113 RepID=A0A127R2B6_9BURK|nr:cell division protein FtsB [Collimonas pratensis]AMP06110.1 septum formation initiator family protein [Collimonas pratensis]AMP16042.1 septum formation initiator family protein [Collimonas pratensis]NKI70391.1 cell division protein FtsB [Collimonas pratensis]
MRLIAIFLTVLLLLVQYPLWLGKGGWLRVWDMDQQVHAAHDKIAELKARNAKLDSEVHDLKEGTGAVEERARTELGMIKQDEIFIQILDPNGNPADAPAPPNPELTAVEKTIAVAVPDERGKKPQH